MTRRSTIGFDRRINLEWLDAAAGQAAAGVRAQEFRSTLWELLDGLVSGATPRSARGKTVTVLNHIWGEVPKPARPLRERAVALLDSCSPDERLALHWAMMLGTYPVFADTAGAIGRLLALQGSFALSHVMRRLVASWGERSTLERAVQRIVRSMVQWEVLSDAAVRGTYRAAPTRTAGASLGMLFIEALIIDAGGAAAPLDQLKQHAALFPFVVSLDVDHVNAMPHMRVHREGLDVNVVELIRGAGQ